MESVQKRASDQVGGPDQAGGPNEEPPADTSQCETRNLGCEQKEERKPRNDHAGVGKISHVATQRMNSPDAKWIVVLFIRHDDNVHTVRWVNSDICHDVNQDVFLDVEWTWIETELLASD